jgi:divalent metal cation (Fe/Co/Zn/Cd) transporter
MSLAMRALLAGARQKRWPVSRYIRESPDTTIKTVFFEDGAALTGLVIAITGLGLSEATGNEAWDGTASVLIGFVLAAVALILGIQSRNLLIGASANAETRQAIRAAVEQFPEVERALSVLTMMLGAHSVLVTGEVQVRADLPADAIEKLIDRIDDAVRVAAPEVVNSFWEVKRRADGDLAGGRPGHAAYG